MMSYSEYKAGFLPEKGGMMEQPVVYREYMMLVGIVLTWCDEQKRNKDANKPSGSVSLLKGK